MMLDSEDDRLTQSERRLLRQIGYRIGSRSATEIFRKKPRVVFQFEEHHKDRCGENGDLEARGEKMPPQW